MPTETDILSLAHAYCLAAGVPLSTVSARVFDDGKRLQQIREGGGITLARYNKALCWFSANWPDNAVWPSHVERPLTEVAP